MRRLIALRRGHPTFRRRDFFAGHALHGGELKDLLWLKPDGAEMSGRRVGARVRRAASACTCRARRSPTVGRHGRPIVDDDFLVLFNAHHEDVEFSMPDLPGDPWQALLDTRESSGIAAPRSLGVADALSPGSAARWRC